MSESADDRNAKEERTSEELKTISAGELFEGGREILIEHDGETYRLRITRRNKLILQK